MLHKNYILLFVILFLCCTPIVKYKPIIVDRIESDSSVKKVRLINQPIGFPLVKKGEESIGKRTKVSVQKTVMKNLAALRYVYNKRLKHNPGLFGTVVVEFRITSEGEVIADKVYASTTMDTTFDNSIKEKILKWRFDTLSIPDTTIVRYPFRFTSDKITPVMEKERFLDCKKSGRRNSYKLYNRVEILQNELNLDCCHSENDSIKGTISIKITIQSSGAVENVVVMDNNLNDNVFSNNVLNKVKLFDFKKDNHNENTVLKWQFYFDKNSLICPGK